MRNHQREYRRVWFIVALFLGSCACLSCHSDRQTDSFLEGQSQELVDWTIPIDSSSVVRGTVQRTSWAETASWEFDTKMSRADYAGWMTEKLRERLRVVSRTDSQLSFSRNLNGDMEAITVHLVPLGGNLHVRVEAVVSPD